MSRSIIQRALAPISRRVRLMISRAVVEIVNDALKCQTLQVSCMADELHEDVERFQDYGITSVPDPGAEGLFLSVGGNRSHGVVINVMDRQYRPLSLNAGDVCLYTKKGERVYLDHDNDIVNLGAKSGAEFVALADKVLTELNSIKSDFDSHVHEYNAPLHPAVPPTLDTAAPTAMTAPTSVAATKVKAT